MAKRGEMYVALHDKGMSYTEIGDIFGVSKQAVQQAIAYYNKTPYLPPVAEELIRKVKYEGLSNWMLANCVTFAELERRCGGVRLRKPLLFEFDPSKKNIDAILRVTGLTYEECFKEREGTAIAD